MKSILYKSIHSLFKLILFFTFITFTNVYSQTTVWSESFEAGWGTWWADNGVWDIGVATSGPSNAHTGQNCAGTVLGGNYPYYANTRLISPEIILPSISGDEKIQLKFWHWYIMQYGADNGVIQISINSGDWQTISSPKFDGTNNVWSQYIADLSAYKDSTVRIAFYFNSDGNTPNMGWYIDDVSIEKKTVIFQNPEDFELGIKDWYSDNGLWEVGTPTVGPTSAHSGQNCAGTVLDGNYPYYANTRLISPEIILPSISGDEKIQLKFWHWYIMQYGADNGVIQISINSGDWQTISSPKFDGTNNVWSQYIADLSAYKDSTVRIAFYFNSDGNTPNMGWYIDDVSIEKKTVIFQNPEDFELGIKDWYSDNGLWEVGTPTVGPTSAHSGQNCAGTVLDGNYPYYANTRLISPEIILTPQGGATPWLFFYHWYIMLNNLHEGYIQISVNGGQWETISSIFTGTNNTWSQYGQNLSAYKDSTVRIAFYFNSDGNTPNIGWYIDDIRIEGIQPVPVDLISFTSSSGSNIVTLNWETATETNNAGFSIERSIDNRIYSEISYIEGNGTTTEKSNYSFVDNNPIIGKSYYRLKQIDFDGSSEYSQSMEIDFGAPTEFKLSQNYPNPFNPATIINYSLPEAGTVKLDIYNSLGQKVIEVLNEQKPVGYHEVVFDASQLSSGVYFYTLTAGSFTETKKMLLMK